MNKPTNPTQPPSPPAQDEPRPIDELVSQADQYINPAYDRVIVLR